MTQPKLLPPRLDGSGHRTRLRAWSMTMLLVLVYVINSADKAVLGLAAQPLSKELGLSTSQLGLIGSGFYLTYTVGGFFAGLLHRWLTIRWLLIALSLAWAMTMLPVVLAASFAVLLASRLTLGLFEGPSSALVHTAAYSWHPVEKRGLPGAWLASGGSIAKIAVVPVLAWIAVDRGWRAAFITLTVIGVAWCALWLATWQEGPHGARRASRDVADNTGDTSSARVPWTRIFFTPTFVAGVLAVFSMYALVTVVFTWLPSYFEVGLGFSRLQAGTMFGFPSIAGMIALMLSTFVSDRLLSRGATSRALRGILPATGLLVCGLAMVVLPLVDTPVLAVVVVSVGYGIGSIVFPLLNAAISQICPAKQLSGALGVFLALMSIGGVIAPYLTGVILDAAESPASGYATAFQFFGAVALVTSVLALFAVNPERDGRRVSGFRASAADVSASGR